jgi:hypothetical protein
MVLRGGFQNPVKRHCGGSTLIECDCSWYGLETDLAKGLADEPVCPTCHAATIRRVRCNVAPVAKCLHCGKLFCRIHIDDHLKSMTQIEEGESLGKQVKQ